VKTIQIK